MVIQERENQVYMAKSVIFYYAAPSMMCTDLKQLPRWQPRLAEQAERYDEMVTFMKDVAKVRQSLSLLIVAWTTIG